MKLSRWYLLLSLPLHLSPLPTVPPHSEPKALPLHRNCHHDIYSSLCNRSPHADSVAWTPAWFASTRRSVEPLTHTRLSLWSLLRQMRHATHGNARQHKATPRSETKKSLHSGLIQNPSVFAPLAAEVRDVDWCCVFIGIVLGEKRAAFFPNGLIVGETVLIF